jgi:hypothetical protein
MIPDTSMIQLRLKKKEWEWFQTLQLFNNILKRKIGNDSRHFNDSITSEKERMEMIPDTSIIQLRLKKKEWEWFQTLQWFNYVLKRKSGNDSKHFNYSMTSQRERVGMIPDT